MYRQDTQARYWCEVCTKRLGPDPRALLRDPWTRRMLGEAADMVLATGVDGFAWQFADDSRLIVTSDVIQAFAR